MKKIFLPIIAFLILSGLSLHAQDLSMGLRAGAGVSDIIQISEYKNLQTTYTPDISGALGGYLLKKFNKSTGMTVEAGYCLKGATDNEAISYYFHYLGVSSLFTYFPSRKIMTGIGPELSYLLKTNTSSDMGGNDPTKYYKTFEFAASVEAGYIFSKLFMAGIRYGIGLTKITENPLTDPNGDLVGSVRKYNHYLHISVRYRLFYRRY
jgi:hypothetical protein